MHVVMCLILSFICIIIITSSTITKKYLEFPFYNQNYSPFIQVNNTVITNPRSLTLNTKNDFTWYSYGDFNWNTIDPSQYLKVNLIPFANNNYSAILLASNISQSQYDTINNYTIRNFNLYAIEISQYYSYISGVGLAFKFRDTKQSFIHQLYYQHIITHLQFTIITPPNGKVFFGKPCNDKVYNDIRARLHSCKCKVNNTQNLWSCDLDKIKHGDNELTTIVSNYFYTSSFYMIESKYLFDFIGNVILANDINSGMCKLIYDKAKLAAFDCSPFAIDNKSNIEFHFKDMIISLPFRYLFDNINERYLSRFIWNDKITKEEEGSLYFGYPFMRMFNMTTFNYETEMIEIYGDNKEYLIQKVFYNNNNNNNNNMNIKVIYILISVLNVFGSVLLYHNKNIII